MKKLNYLLLAVMTMLFAASCSQDDTFSSINEGDNATVSFTLEIPESGPQSRAIGDGTAVDELTYAVYGSENSFIMKETVKDVIFTDGKKVSISLAKDQEYKVVFWAQKTGAPYTFADEGTITVNYNGSNNDEGRDAFYKVVDVDLKESTSFEVKLQRPFAQLNVGTADYTEASTTGLKVMFSKVTIEKAASKINLLTGVTSEPVKVVYAYNNIPSDPEVLNVNSVPYRYLSMSYILVENNKDNVILEYELSTDANGGGKKVELISGLTEVPVQPNFRTNIIGNLLTDQADFDVSIDDDFDGDNDENYNAKLRAIALAEANEAIRELNPASQREAARKALTNPDLGLDLTEYNKLYEYSPGVFGYNRQQGVPYDLHHYGIYDVEYKPYTYEELKVAFNTVTKNRLAKNMTIIHIDGATTAEDLIFNSFLGDVLASYSAIKELFETNYNSHPEYSTGYVAYLEKLGTLYNELDDSQKDVVLKNFFQHRKDYNITHPTPSVFVQYSTALEALEAQILVAKAEGTLSVSDIEAARTVVEALKEFDQNANIDGRVHQIPRKKLLARLDGDYAIGVKLYVEEGKGWLFSFGTSQKFIKEDISDLSLKLLDGDRKHIVTRKLKPNASIGANSNSAGIRIPYLGSSWYIEYGEGVNEDYIEQLIYDDKSATPKVIKEIPDNYKLEATVKYKNGVVVTKSTNRYRTIFAKAYAETAERKAFIIEMPVDVSIKSVKTIHANWGASKFEWLEDNKVRISYEDGRVLSTVQHKVTLTKDDVDYVNTIQPSSHIKDKDNATRLSFMEIK